MARLRKERMVSGGGAVTRTWKGVHAYMGFTKRPFHRREHERLCMC